VWRTGGNPSISPVNTCNAPEDLFSGDVLKRASRCVTPDKEDTFSFQIADCHDSVRGDIVARRVVEDDITCPQRISSRRHYGKQVTVTDEGLHAYARSPEPDSVSLPEEFLGNRGKPFGISYYIRHDRRSAALAAQRLLKFVLDG
jgi:hypothetical protein